jgi:hypothetical protein
VRVGRNSQLKLSHRLTLYPRAYPVR